MMKLTDIYKTKKQKSNNKDNSTTENFKKFKKKQHELELLDELDNQPTCSTKIKDFSTPCTKQIKKKLEFPISPLKKSKLNKDDSISKYSDQKDLKDENSIYSLKNFDLPKSVIDYYKSKNIENVFEWQYDCLNLGDVLNGQNLIFSAPTSAGKTIISDILLIRTVLKRQKKALLVLPFISLANEKVVALEAMLKYTTIKVGGFMGNCLPVGRFPSVNIAVCTIEKANNIVNKLIEDNNLSDLGIIVIDELHLLGDSSRGYLLELLLTKIKYASNCSDFKVQILGMSATLPNIDEIASWLDAQKFISNFRPVPLFEQIKIKENIHNVRDKEIIRSINDIKVKVNPDPSFTLSLALETILNNNGTLVFCATKDLCEKLAEQLSKTIKNLGLYNGSEEKFSSARRELREVLNEENLKEVLIQLSKCPAKLDKVLSNTIPFGIAFHHAGLSMNERDIIESAFKNGVLKALFATPTLSSGVNLPARRVIINSVKIGISLLNSFTYKQMIGRAGRKGVDSKGESILICNPNEETYGWELTQALLGPINSCLVKVDQQNNLSFEESLRRGVLEVITNGLVDEFEKLKNYLNSTFFAEKVKKFTDDEVQSVLNLLMNHSNDDLNNVVSEFNKPFIQKLTGENSEKLLPTKLGLAVSYSSMSPRDAFKMFNELKLAMKGLVLSCDLHLIYQVVPNKDIENKNVNWKKFSYFYSTIERDEALKNVADIIQISGGFIIGALTGKRFNSSYQRTIKERHVKFYYALALNDLIAEKPLAEVAEKYDINKGELQQLQQRSSSYCGMMSTFCKKLGWDSLALVIKLFQDRLFFGITQDLIDLMNIPCLNGQMARCLFDSGFKDVKSIAHSNIMEIEKAFLNYGPFEIKENKNDYKKFWISVRCKSMNEKEISDLIIKEARSVVEELAGVRINWDDNDSFLEIKKLDDSYSNELIETDSNINKTKVQAKFFNDNLAQIDSQSHSIISNNESRDEHSPTFDNDIPDTNDFYSKLKKTMLKDSTLISTSSENSFLSTQVKETQKNNLSSSSKQKNFSSFLNHIDDDSVIFSLSQDNKTEDKKAESSLLENSKIVLDSSDDSSRSPSITSRQKDLFEDSSSNSSFQEKESSNNIFSNHKIISLSSNFLSSSDDNREIKQSQSLLFGTNSNIELFPSESEDNSENSNSSFDDSNKYFENTFNNISSDESNFQIIDNLSEGICQSINQSKFKCNFKEINKTNIYSFIEEWKKTKVFSIDFDLEKKFFSKKSWSSKNSICEMSIKINQKEFNVLNRMSFYFGTELLYIVKDHRIFYLLEQQLEDFNFKENFVTCICFDLKTCYKIFKLFFNFKEETFKKIYWQDPKIACWLLDSDSREPVTLFDLVDDYLESRNSIRFLKKIDQLISQDKESIIHLLTKTKILFPIMSKLRNLLIEKKLYKNYLNIEIPVLIIFAEMELNGFTIDNDFLNKLTDQCKEITESLEKKIFSRGKINLNSPKEISSLLFKDEKMLCKFTEIIGDKKSTKKFPDHLKTNKEILEKLRKYDELPGFILDWRKMNCLKDPLSSITEEIYLDENKNKKVFGVYNHWLSTGRVAMFKPNLLSIQKDFQINLDKNLINLCLRKAFISKPGFILVTADYCQIELRILAALAKEKNLIKIFENNQDPFKIIASSVFKKDFSLIDDHERNTAKEIVYSIIYGCGLESLANKLGVIEQVATSFLTDFKNAFPQLDIFKESCIKNCQENGYIETIFKRLRYLPNINHEHPSLKNKAERVAFNSIIQGSASDLIKYTMLRLERNLKDFDYNLLLQMHDELIFEIKNDEKLIEKFINSLIKEMTFCGKILKTKLDIKIKIGPNWSDLETYSKN